nr:type VII secretion system-associated protein [Nocardia arthritidis]
MQDLTSSVVRRADWVVFVDSGWHETSPEAMPPPELILGGWMIREDGIPGPFEPNPNYVPTDEALPTDPIDAALRRAADGDNVTGEEIIAALRDAVVEIGCDNRNEPLVGRAPDGAQCVVVATAAIHKHRFEADRWWPVLGAALSDIVPDGADILINPGSPTRFLLLTRSLLDSSACGEPSRAGHAMPVRPEPPHRTPSASGENRHPRLAPSTAIQPSSTTLVQRIRRRPAAEWSHAVLVHEFQHVATLGFAELRMQTVQRGPFIGGSGRAARYRLDDLQADIANLRPVLHMFADPCRFSEPPEIDQVHGDLFLLDLRGLRRDRDRDQIVQAIASDECSNVTGPHIGVIRGDGALQPFQGALQIRYGLPLTDARNLPDHLVRHRSHTGGRFAPGSVGDGAKKAGQRRYVEQVDSLECAHRLPQLVDADLEEQRCRRLTPHPEACPFGRDPRAVHRLRGDDGEQFVTVLDTQLDLFDPRETVRCVVGKDKEPDTDIMFQHAAQVPDHSGVVARVAEEYPHPAPCAVRARHPKARKTPASCSIRLARSHRSEPRDRLTS